MSTCASLRLHLFVLLLAAGVQGQNGGRRGDINLSEYDYSDSGLPKPSSFEPAPTQPGYGHCECGGPIAAAVVITAIVCILLFVGWWCFKGGKFSHVLKPDPEAASRAAYDNPHFQHDECEISLEGNERKAGTRGSQAASVAAVSGQASTKSTATNTTSTLERSKSTLEKVMAAVIRGTRGADGPKRSKDDSCLGHEDVIVPLEGHDFTGLGFSVHGSLKNGLFVKDVMARGPASQSAQVVSGDRILAVTVLTDHVVYKDALAILSYASPYPVLLHLRKNIHSSLGSISPSPSFGSKRKFPCQTKISERDLLIHPSFRSQSYGDLTKIEDSEIRNLKLANLKAMKIKSSLSTTDASKPQNIRAIRKTENRHSERAIDVPGVENKSKSISDSSKVDRVSETDLLKAEIQIHQSMSTSTDLDVPDASIPSSKLNELIGRNSNEEIKLTNSFEEKITSKSNPKTKFGVKVFPDIIFPANKVKNENTDLEYGNIEGNSIYKSEYSPILSHENETEVRDNYENKNIELNSETAAALLKKINPCLKIETKDNKLQRKSTDYTVNNEFTNKLNSTLDANTSDPHAKEVKNVSQDPSKDAKISRKQSNSETEKNTNLSESREVSLRSEQSENIEYVSGKSGEDENQVTKKNIDKMTAVKAGFKLEFPNFNKTSIVSKKSDSGQDNEENLKIKQPNAINSKSKELTTTNVNNETNYQLNKESEIAKNKKSKLNFKIGMPSINIPSFYSKASSKLAKDTDTKISTKLEKESDKESSVSSKSSKIIQKEKLKADDSENKNEENEAKQSFKIELPDIHIPSFSLKRSSKLEIEQKHETRSKCSTKDDNADVKFNDNIPEDSNISQEIFESKDESNDILKNKSKNNFKIDLPTIAAFVSRRNSSPEELEKCDNSTENKIELNENDEKNSLSNEFNDKNKLEIKIDSQQLNVLSEQENKLYQIDNKKDKSNKNKDKVQDVKTDSNKNITSEAILETKFVLDTEAKNEIDDKLVVNAKCEILNNLSSNDEIHSQDNTCDLSNNNTEAEELTMDNINENLLVLKSSHSLDNRNCSGTDSESTICCNENYKSELNLSLDRSEVVDWNCEKIPTLESSDLSSDDEVLNDKQKSFMTSLSLNVGSESSGEEKDPQKGGNMNFNVSDNIFSISDSASKSSKVSIEDLNMQVSEKSEKEENKSFNSEELTSRDKNESEFLACVQCVSDDIVLPNFEERNCKSPRTIELLTDSTSHIEEEKICEIKDVSNNYFDSEIYIDLDSKYNAVQLESDTIVSTAGTHNSKHCLSDEVKVIQNGGVGTSSINGIDISLNVPVPKKRGILSSTLLTGNKNLNDHIDLSNSNSKNYTESLGDISGVGMNITDAIKKKKFEDDYKKIDLQIPSIDDSEQSTHKTLNSQQNQSDEMKSKHLTLNVADDKNNYLDSENVECSKSDNVPFQIPRVKIPLLKAKFSQNSGDGETMTLINSKEFALPTLAIENNKNINECNEWNVKDDDLRIPTANVSLLREKFNLKMKASNLNNPQNDQEHREQANDESKFMHDVESKCYIERHIISKSEVDETDFIIPDLKSDYNSPLNDESLTVSDQNNGINTKQYEPVWNQSNFTSRTLSNAYSNFGEGDIITSAVTSRDINISLDSSSIENESDLPEADSYINKHSSDYSLDISVPQLSLTKMNLEKSFNKSEGMSITRNNHDLEALRMSGTNGFGNIFGFRGFKQHASDESEHNEDGKSRKMKLLDDPINTNTGELPEVDYDLDCDFKDVSYPESDISFKVNGGNIYSEKITGHVKAKTNGNHNCTLNSHATKSEMIKLQSEHLMPSDKCLQDAGVNMHFHDGKADNEIKNTPTKIFMASNFQQSKNKAKDVKLIESKKSNDINSLHYKSNLSDEEIILSSDEQDFNDQRKTHLRKKSKENGKHSISLKDEETDTTISLSESSSDDDDSLNKIKLSDENLRKNKNVLSISSKITHEKLIDENQQFYENGDHIPLQRPSTSHITIISSEPQSMNIISKHKTESDHNTLLLKEITLKKSNSIISSGDSKEEFERINLQENGPRSIFLQKQVISGNENIYDNVWNSDGDMGKIKSASEKSNLSSSVMTTDSSTNTRVLTDFEELRRKTASLGDLSKFQEGISASNSVLERAVSLDLKNASVGQSNLHIRRLELPDSSTTSIEESDAFYNSSSPKRFDVSSNLKSATQWGTLQEAMNLEVDCSKRIKVKSTLSSPQIIPRTSVTKSNSVDEGTRISNIEISGVRGPSITALSTKKGDNNFEGHISSESMLPVSRDKTTINILDKEGGNILDDNLCLESNVVVVGSEGPVNNFQNFNFEINSSIMPTSEIDSVISHSITTTSNTNNSGDSDGYNPRLNAPGEYEDASGITITMVSTENEDNAELIANKNDNNSTNTNSRKIRPLSLPPELIAHENLETSLVTVNHENMKENSDLTAEHNISDEFITPDSSPQKSMTQITLDGNGYTVTDGTVSRTVIISNPDI